MDINQRCHGSGSVNNSDSESSQGRVPYRSGYFDDKQPWVRRKTMDQFSTWHTVPDQTFPNFIRLPLEIRQLIWEHFCPDLAARSRVYDFSLRFGQCIDEGLRRPGDLRNRSSLRYQTLAARTVMAVHRESRLFAAKVLPDTLPFHRGKYELRFNKERDVIYIDHNQSLDVCLDAPCQLIPGVTDQIYQLAFDEHTFSFLKPPLTELLGAFPNLQRTYVQLDYSFTRIQDLKWCISDKVNQSYHEEFVVAYDGPGYQSRRYIWPDFTTQSGRDHAHSQIPLDTIALSQFRYDSWYEEYEGSNFLKAAREAGMDIWPMAKFGQDHGEEALERLENYILTGEIDDKPYGDSDCDRFNGWAGYVTVSETSGDGFDPRDDEESSTGESDDDDGGQSTSNSEDGDGMTDENGQPFVHNSRGEKVLVSDVPPGSIIFYDRCPALASESEDEGGDGDDEAEAQ